MTEQPPEQTGPQWTPPPSPAPDAPPNSVPANSVPANSVPPPPQWQQPQPPAPMPVAQQPYGQPAAPQAYVEQRPGIIPLRPLQMGDVYAGVTNAIRGNLAATLGLSLIVTLIFVLPGTALGLLFARSSTIGDTFNDTELVGAQGELAANFTGVFQSFGTFLLSAFMAFVIGRGAVGDRVSPAQTWAGTKGKLWAVLGGVVLTGLAFIVPLLVLVALPLTIFAITDSAGWMVVTVIGFFAIAVCFLLLWVRLAFVSPSIVLEKIGPISGLKRSWKLSQGHFWRLFGIRLLAGVGIAVVSAIMSAPLGFALGGLGAASGADASTMATGAVLIAALSSIVTGTLTAPFMAGVDALLYVDMRIRKEALDVQLMAAASATG